MFGKFPKRFAAILLLLSACPAAGSPLTLYIDADYSINADAAASIEQGVRTALAQSGNLLGGEPVEVVPRDHRGNVNRSRATMQDYVDSPDAIALIGGLHSPPYITHQSFLNRNGVLTLLPWSAAGPITRPAADEENWIFRLSVDDTKSGEFLIREASDRERCARIALILLDTGWGHSNYDTLVAALERRGARPSLTEFFPTSVGTASARTLAKNVARSEADCAILLANWDDGATIVGGLNEYAPNLRIFSHWGITGGAFAEHIPAEVRARMQIRVLQTCGLRREKVSGSVLARALSEAEPDATGLADLPAPTGFVHGYDLTRTLIAAADQAMGDPGWSGDIAAKRAALRRALEALETPVPGILRTYIRPFRPYAPEDPDAHEALGLGDLCLARFREDGRLEDDS